MTPAWVLVTGDFALHGGQDRANYELARHLAERGGAEVHLVAHRADADLVALPGVRFHLVPRPLGSHFLAEPQLAHTGMRVAREVTARFPGARVVVNGGNCPWPDVSWVHAVHQAWPVVDAGAPLAYRVKNRASKWSARRKERVALSCARLVIANSDRTRMEVIERLGIAPERVERVYLAVDPSEYALVSPSEREEARAKLTIPAGETVALFVGALPYDRNKGLDTIIAAWSKLRDRSRAPVLLVAGGGQLEFWRARVHEAGLDERVRLLGPTPTRALFAAADVLVAPSRYEAYGLAVHEAFCRGVPAIVSSRAGVAERLTPALVPLRLEDPESADELAERIVAWQSETATFARAAAALGEELRRWTWRDMAARMVERIEHVGLDSAPAPRGVRGRAAGADVARPRLAFVCESGTDVRLIEGLRDRFELTVLIRAAFGGREINWPVESPETLRIERGPAGRVAFAVWAGRWLLAHESAIDAVVVQNTGLSALAANVVRRRTHQPTFPFVCSPNTDYFRCRWRKGEISAPTYAAGLALLESTRWLNAQLTDRYIVLSDHLAGCVASDGRTRSDIIPIYGVDTTKFTPASKSERAALRRKLELPEGAYVLIFSSRVAPEKDTQTLMEAAKIMAAAKEDFLLLNLSGGHKAFLEHAARMGLGDHVVARNAVHPSRDLADYYRVSDLCLQASVEEGLGFSPLEALACEVPVIATAVGGLKETIREGVTGLTVPVGEAQAWVDAIRRARREPEKMKEMARRGRALVESHYRADLSFDRMVAAVEDGIAKTRQPR